VKKNKMEYILTSEQLKGIKLTDLKKIGVIDPNKYYLSLLSCISKSRLNITPAKTGSRPLNFIKQREPITIEDKKFLLTLICSPYPQEKKDKPSGLVFEDLSYLQVKELLFYDVKDKELYSFEYSYHYGIWDFTNEKEKYHFRYDRDILLQNPPKKNVEHFHVFFDKPHFDSSFITFNEVLQFLENNWDNENQCLEMEIS
jgi:Family of unknown function (DUF6516)